jgi:hypothetical protein
MTKTIRLGVTETIRLGMPKKKNWLGTTNEKRPGIPRGGRLGIAPGCSTSRLKSSRSSSALRGALQRRRHCPMFHRLRSRQRWRCNDAATAALFLQQRG